ncbi:histone deacetylase family protein [Rheinheimera riviphila]|uniref:Histone deacetylase family protein n=1 Tax=Rheinheimera riviphila TaxID=1834037 RepID=A0A437QEQ5_9GAMM|nr:histone deacetylase family protein [Rheinheimera riviphila]RVU32996.1 histone deacetylase family protein [Rheinheimera riviphila]
MSVTIFSHPGCLQHNVGLDHPEQPARLHAIADQLLSSGLEYVLQQRDATPVTDDQLALVHDRAYIGQVIAKVPEHGCAWLDDDTAIMNKSLHAARHAAGAVVNAVDLVMQLPDQQAFCAIRPPGHHAESAQAMGFCLFNNVAVGAAYAMQTYGLQRIAIVDFDVHHGNGTEQIFRNDQRVLFCSSFEHPYYPFTDPASHNLLLKIPLPGNSDGQEFRRRASAQWFEQIRAFQPQLLMISAGFDAHIEDELAHLKWTDADYHWLAQQLKLIANECCDGRIVACLEGGYALNALGRSVVAMLKAWI